MRDIKELVLAWYNEDDGTEEEFEYCDKNLIEIFSDDVHNHKWITYSTVYKDTSTEKYYKAWVRRTDNGYWGDSEKVDEGCYEVVPKEIKTTIYEAVK